MSTPKLGLGKKRKIGTKPFTADEKGKKKSETTQTTVIRKKLHRSRKNPREATWAKDKTIRKLKDPLQKGDK